MDLIKNIKTNLDKISKIKSKDNYKYSVFTLGNTRVKNSKNFYLTPIRTGDNFILFGAVVFSEEEGKIILKYLDSKVDLIYVDCEKKSSNNNLKKGLFNLERLSYEIIKKSKLRFYKGNDLTVECVDSLVLNIMKNEKRLVGGSNILVVGMGNLGFKISLKLVERGANLKVLSLNNENSKLLINTINMVKPKETISIVKNVNIQTDFKLFDIIILCHLSTIESYTNYYKMSKSSCYFIDVGKGCLSPNQLKILKQKKNMCLRIDIGDSITDFISNDIKYAFEDKFELPSSKVINGSKIVSKGIIGNKGDIVVDNVNKPKFIYGICDGVGGLNRDIEYKMLLKKINYEN